MSAESPHKSNSRGGHVVAPQPVNDRTIIESVAGFINEVVPQAYTSLPLSEGKEAITWARFEYGDINDPALYPDSVDDQTSTPPLLLVLGYGCGVQVWSIPANGDATEVLSWRQGVVRTLRVLPTPLADSPVPDAFAHKRPLVALCDSAGPGPQFCSLSFISLRCGDQVKNIKFKNPVSDVLANRHSVVVTFSERIAVFDASTLEDRLTVTTCYPCPGPNSNPVGLGSRWLAYAERHLLHSRRSSGGSEGEGVQSYTATVLHAAKSLGKGLRELGETVASSLTGTGGSGIQRVPGGIAGPPGTANLNVASDALQPGVVTILDAQGISSSRGDDSGPASSNTDLMIAHFAAHSEPIVALQFDPSGMLLLTADKRGHDFHVFRIQPHPNGSSLAAVHHLYVLHRGDTTAKVQDVAFAADSRWVAVSTLRGTTHVFPITPYGGPVGIRTHTTPHVVNRLSRFHRSAGLTADGRNSPVPTAGSTTSSGNYESTILPPAMPYPNPRLPPYPHPTVINPLAQIRQPLSQMLSGMTPISPTVFTQQTYHRNPSSRMVGRSQSVSDDGSSTSGLPLRVTACFAAPRAWLVSSPTVPRESSTKMHKRSIDSLFVMACHGSLIQYDLEPKHVAAIPKEKVCDDTAIELEVKAKAQWLLLHPPHSSELQPPLPASNPLMVLPDHLPPASESHSDDLDERWLSQVEIVTHAGPHRRLWMGPQFTFKTYTNATFGTPLSLLEMEAVEIGTGLGSRPARSNPVNMPLSGRPVVPVLIESGSASSYEQSPRLIDAYGADADSDGSAGPGDSQLREDLADAMMESPGVPIRDTGRRSVFSMHGKKSAFPVEKVVNPVGTVITVAVQSDEEAGGPPSPAANTRDCERVLPADIGKVDINVVRCQSTVQNPEEWNKETDQESMQATNKNIQYKYSSIPNSFPSVHQTVLTNESVSLRENVTFSPIHNNTLSSDLQGTRSPEVSCNVQERALKIKHLSRKEVKHSDSDLLSSETSDNYFKQRDMHQSSSVAQQNLSRVTEPFKSDCVNIYDSSSSVSVKKAEFHLEKASENHSSCTESCKTDECTDLFVREGKGVLKKNKRGNGKKKLDSVNTQILTPFEEKSSENGSSQSSAKLNSIKMKYEDHLFSFADIAKGKKNVSTIEVSEEKESISNTSLEGNESQNLKFVSNEQNPSKLCTEFYVDTSGELNSDQVIGKSISTRVDKTCVDDKLSATIHIKSKHKVHLDSSKSEPEIGSINKNTYAENVEKKNELQTLSLEEFNDTVTCDLPNVTTQTCGKALCTNTDESLEKSWNSLLSSIAKTNPSLKRIADVDKENSSHSCAEFSLEVEDSGLHKPSVSYVNDCKSPWNKQSVDSLFTKEDSKNNNRCGRKLNQSLDRESPPYVSQQSWSSIVTLSKPGTSSSTDEGSYGYDSNESKDSTDVALNVVDDKTEVELESANVYESAVNCDSNVLEDEVSDDVKVVNDDDVAVDSMATAGSSKRNRRTKKKRR